MPGRDGRGPTGAGPRTGREMGRCGPDREGQLKPGCGCGCGRGHRHGQGECRHQGRDGHQPPDAVAEPSV